MKKEINSRNNKNLKLEEGMNNKKENRRNGTYFNLKYSKI